MLLARCARGRIGGANEGGERPPRPPPTPPLPLHRTMRIVGGEGGLVSPPPLRGGVGGKGARGDARGALCAPLGLLSLRSKDWTMGGAGGGTTEGKGQRELPPS
nr:hypothetical protein [Morchella crassipes]